MLEVWNSVTWLSLTMASSLVARVSVALMFGTDEDAITVRPARVSCTVSNAGTVPELMVAERLPKKPVFFVTSL